MADWLRLGFTGDVMLGRLVDRHQHQRPVEAVWGNLFDELTALDGLFINLECCISARGEQWTRTYRPFHFRADPEWAIPALTAAGVDWASLANNHLLDYGEVALLDTLDHLDDAGIARAGAGRNIDEATTPSLVTIGDLTVSLIAFTDNTPEFSADQDTPGTAHIEIDTEDRTTRQVVRESLDAATGHDPDLLIASLHWGPNMVEAPPAEFEEFARWLIDNGVDIIHGHSAHIFQGIEVYENRPILYDTGDFVDDYAVDDDLRNDRSFLFEFTVTPTGMIQSLTLHPIEIFDFSVHAAEDDAAEWSRDRMRALSAPYGTEFERDGDSLVLPFE